MLRVIQQTFGRYSAIWLLAFGAQKVENEQGRIIYLLSEEQATQSC